MVAAPCVLGGPKEGERQYEPPAAGKSLEPQRSWLGHAGIDEDNVAWIPRLRGLARARAANVAAANTGSGQGDSALGSPSGSGKRRVC